MHDSKLPLRPRRYEILAFLFMFAFGLAMIANSLGTADGTWFWYAVLLRNGVRLYSQLHLALQPFFVLETAGFISIFGKTWLAGKLAAVIHVAALSIGFILITRYSDWPGWQRTLLASAAFFMEISTIAFRFDDYHVLAELFVVYAILLLLRIDKGVSLRSSFVLSGVLGSFSALSFATRVNNGGALFIGAAIAILCLVPVRRWVALAIFVAAAALTLVILVRMTGDSFHDYWMCTVTKAAASKGGSSSILTYPFVLPWHTVQFLQGMDNWQPVLLFAVVCAVWAYVIRPALPVRTMRATGRLAIGLALILISVLRTHHRGLQGSLLFSVAALATFLLYGFGIWAFLSWIGSWIAPRPFQHWNRLQILLLIPLGQLAGEALSTGATHGEIYMPMAILFLLLPLAFPMELKARGRSLLLAAATMLLCIGFVYRVIHPYRWWNFRNVTMFRERQWFRHPVYGPMIIERDMLSLLQPVCDDIDARDGHHALLSLPFSFANYFCDVPPWHDYVQTWYDTSGAGTIDAMMKQLQEAPPEWIFYERQPEAIHLHEQVYNAGRPIPHRYLDQLIEQKISEGAWKVVYRNSYNSTPELKQDWLLIRTKE